MKLADEIERCPFCGGEPREQVYEPHEHFLVNLPPYPGAWSIECDTCEIRMFSHESREATIAKWNKRAALRREEGMPRMGSVPIYQAMFGAAEQESKDNAAGRDRADIPDNRGDTVKATEPVPAAPTPTSAVEELLKRAIAIMRFHAGRCPLNPWTNYSGSEEHLAEYRDVLEAARRLDKERG